MCVYFKHHHLCLIDFQGVSFVDLCKRNTRCHHYTSRLFPVGFYQQSCFPWLMLHLLYMLSVAQENSLVCIRSLKQPLAIFCWCLHIPHDLCCSFYMYYLLQNVGTLWYFLTIEREDDCWHLYCDPNVGCNSSYLYCNNNHHGSYDSWLKTNGAQVFNMCNGTQDNFNFGIYQQALVSGILRPGNFISKLCYCFWWGLQNLRYVIAVVYDIFHDTKF